MPEADCVITAVVGMLGLKPTLAAIRAGKRIGRGKLLRGGYDAGDSTRVDYEIRRLAVLLPPRRQEPIRCIKRHSYNPFQNLFSVSQRLCAR